jgi:hypothetical protein
MLDNAKNLPDNPAELKGLVAALASEVKSQAMLIEKLKHQLLGMRRHRFGSTSEAMDQLEFALEEEEIAASADNGAGADEAAPPKEKPKRNATSANRRMGLLAAEPSGVGCLSGGRVSVAGVTRGVPCVVGREQAQALSPPQAPIVFTQNCEGVCLSGDLPFFPPPPPGKSWPCRQPHSP